MKRLWLVLLMVLGGCASTPHPEGKPLPKLNFQYLNPAPVNVRSIHVNAEMQPHPADFVLSPYDETRSYLQQRFAARGTRDALNLYVDEASLQKSAQKADSGIESYFNVGGHDVFTIRLKIRAEHVADNGKVLYAQSVSVTRTMNITQHASVAEREAHEFAGMEALFADLDKQILKIVTQDMRL